MKIDNIILLLCSLLTLGLFTIAGYSIFVFDPPNKLNELGDSIAGFASSLAFIWLVGSVFIQRQELSSVRKEYEQMRISMEAQQRGASRESGIRITRLYLESLDAIGAQFHQKARTMLKAIESLPSSELDSASIFSYVSLKFQQLDEKSEESHVKLIRAKFARTLAVEVSRYRAAYEKMEDYLKSEKDGELIRRILVEDSKYSQVYELISKPMVDESLCSDVFLSRDSN